MKANGYTPTASQKREAEKLLTEEVSAGYRPSLPGLGFWDPQSSTPDLFRFFQDVEAMVVHPRVSDALDVYRSGIAQADFEVEDASSPECAAFLLEEARRFWRRCRADMQRSYEYGRGAFEAVYEDEGGALRIKHVVPFFPPDARVLTRGGKYHGVRVRGLKGEAAGRDLEGPSWRPAKAVWHAHRRRYNRWYGWPQIYPAWRPWRRLAGRDGAEDVVDGGVYRFAFQPPLGRYPHEDHAPRGGSATRYSNRDQMRELLENLKAGGVVALSSRRDEQGNYVWDVQWPEGSLDVSGLLAYTEALEKAISLGIGVPPELREASETGSGYSGRAIPQEVFYIGQQQNAEELYRTFEEQVGLPLLRWNCGPEAWARLKVLDLLKGQKQASAGQEGDGEDVPPGEIGQAPPGGEGEGEEEEGGPASPEDYFGWDESAHPRAQGGRFGDKPGGGKAAPSGPAPAAKASPREAVRALALMAKQLPPRVYAAAKERVVEKYRGLERRYGRRWAVAIMSAGAAGLPLPVPGSSLLTAAPVIVAAEVARKLAARLSRAGSDEVPASEFALDAALSRADVERLGAEFREELLDGWEPGEAAGGEGEEGGRREYAESLAEILYGLLGEGALAALRGDEFGWDESLHPRDSKGRFVRRGTAEAVSAAKGKVSDAIRGKLTAKHSKELAGALSLLTMRQLREVAAEHGAKIPKVLKEELVESVMALLGEEGPEKKGPKKKPRELADDEKSWAEMERRAGEGDPEALRSMVGHLRTSVIRAKSRGDMGIAAKREAELEAVERDLQIAEESYLIMKERHAQAALDALSDAGKPVTADDVAKAAGVTVGVARRALRELAREGEIHRGIDDRSREQFSIGSTPPIDPPDDRLSTLLLDSKLLDDDATKAEADRLHGEYVAKGRELAARPGATGAEVDALADEFGARLKGLKRPAGEKPARPQSEERKVWANKAKEAGVEPKALFSTARQMHSAHTEYHGSASRMLKEARALYRSLSGKTLNRSHPVFRSGDYVGLPHFDQLARTMAGRYPELLGNHGYGGDGDGSVAAEKLFDLLAVGPPAAARVNDYYGEALDHLKSRPPQDEAPF